MSKSPKLRKKFNRATAQPESDHVDEAAAKAARKAAKKAKKKLKKQKRAAWLEQAAINAA